MKTQSAKDILVLGSTGKTGSRVAAGLQQLGYPVRMGSRKADIPFEWNDPNTWPAVVQNTPAVYITFQPDLSVPGADEAIAAFAQVAVAAGVEKLVLLSGRGEPEAQRCEEMVIQSGADWTIVRASWFMQNFTESHLLEPVQAGFVALPVQAVGEPFIDADDIAAVAIAALTDDKHSQQIYEVTGPRLLTFEEAVQEIAAASGNPIQYQQISIEAYTAQLESYGVPQEYISLLGYLFTQVMDGRNASVTHDVERALGRKAKDFSEFVQQAFSVPA